MLYMKKLLGEFDSVCVFVEVVCDPHYTSLPLIQQFFPYLLLLKVAGMKSEAECFMSYSTRITSESPLPRMHPL